jgi:hypothetical protein
MFLHYVDSDGWPPAGKADEAEKEAQQNKPGALHVIEESSLSHFSYCLSEVVVVHKEQTGAIGPKYSFRNAFPR